MLEIKGFLENSLIEWDGRIASVIFLPHCNFRCPWCHVPDLAFHPENLDTVPFWQVEEAIHRQKSWLDGIVISGGEPTVNPSLPEFIEQIKGWEIPVKLEANGSHPEMLRELIEEELIDSVAMDIKNIVEASPPAGTPKLKVKNKYERTVGIKVDLERIGESIDLLMKSGIDYEFRTTVVPAFLGEEDIEKIARRIKGAKRYILQQFVPENVSREEMTRIKPYSQEKLEEMARRARAYVEDCQVRG
ncbi:anaerobic ribonucleoside-triphosphate reductase activating protein [candidate division NPL-UPA2 bacterium]|nr:anaerobic ribonucleoside-triphosphate reductase activating protein [candidate division NPL-UPA2 bacterium]